jgi:phospholipid/cholesterol/gamma-HCH transport system substrate-binding protein
VKTETRVGIFVIGSVLVFLYLSFNIGALRIDQRNYDSYISFFDDTGGLEVRAPVKTSGVKIGWIEAITLREGGKAEVTMKIHKSYKLALNAYAMIQQETLLGQKIVELDQGDFATGTLVQGATLAMPGKSTTNVGDLIDQFKDIAQNVSDIAYSFRTVFATREGRHNLENTLRNASVAADNIASFSDTLDRVLTQKEGALAGAIENGNEVLRELRTDIPVVVDAIDTTAADIRKDVVPAIAKSGAAFDAVRDASVEVRDGVHEAGEVFEKINNGKGLIGKLVNEQETYDDLKRTIHGLKEYVSKIDALQVTVDMHSESLFKYTTSKGYCDLKLRSNSDYFYQLQIMSDEAGRIERRVEDVVRRDRHGDIVSTEGLTELRDQLEYADRREYTTRTKNTYQFGFQFGKRFNRLALRVGLFEDVVGGAIDYYVPLLTKAMHWITSVEVFDLRGTKRLNDTRPHVKWLNRMHFSRNLYVCFGLDDILSKESASPFYGAGLRFNDSDLKYFIGLLAGVLGKK